MPAIASLEDLKAARKEGLGIYAMLYVYPPKPLDLRSLGVGGWRRRTLPVLRSPARRDVGGCSMLYEDGAGSVGRICVEPPIGKGRAIQRLGGGDIPRLTSGQAVQELMVFSAGASFGWRKGLRNS